MIQEGSANTSVPQHFLQETSQTVAAVGSVSGSLLERHDGFITFSPCHLQDGFQCAVCEFQSPRLQGSLQPRPKIGQLASRERVRGELEASPEVLVGNPLRLTPRCFLAGDARTDCRGKERCQQSLRPSRDPASGNPVCRAPRVCETGTEHPTSYPSEEAEASSHEPEPPARSASHKRRKASTPGKLQERSHLETGAKVETGFNFI
nr:uncharacterized protein LOC119713097 isoform X2 [Anas platyrhynchos]